MGVNVNEAGRDDQSRGINHVGIRSDEIAADGGNPVAIYTHVRSEAVCSGTVDDGATGNEECGRSAVVCGIHRNLPFVSIMPTEARGEFRFPCRAPSAPAARV